MSEAAQLESGSAVAGAAADPAREGRRRRPSGEPPPLPKELSRTTIGWLVFFGLWVVVWAWFFIFGESELGVWITERDLELMVPIVDNRVDWLTDVLRGVHLVAVHAMIPLLGWTVILGCLLTRRFRHLIVYLGVLFFVQGVWVVVAREIQRPRPVGIEIIGDWSGYAQPSLPFALLTVGFMGVALTLVPVGPWRRAWYWAGGIGLAVAGFAQVYVGVDHPTDVIVSITMGVALSELAFRVFVPEKAFPVVYGTGRAAHLDLTGARGDAIRQAIANQLGLRVSSIEPFALSGSAGSTPMRIEIDEPPDVLFAKLYARQHLRADRWYKLGRRLLYGRLEDEHPFTSVRRLSQFEDYMLRVMRDAGLPTVTPYGVIEITPDREYLVVTEFLTGSEEMTTADATDQVMDEAFGSVRIMWDAGLAHRDIKPANVLVQDGHVRLIDVAFAQIRPSPWRQAVDLANMALVLALRTDPERVYRHAQRYFTDDELAEAFAASRGVTLPSQLRKEIKDDGRALLEEFRRIAPAREPVALQQWTSRRAGLVLAVGVGGFAALAATIGGLRDVGYL